MRQVIYKGNTRIITPELIEIFDNNYVSVWGGCLIWIGGRSSDGYGPRPLSWCGMASTRVVSPHLQRHGDHFGQPGRVALVQHPTVRLGITPSGGHRPRTTLMIGRRAATQLGVRRTACMARAT